VQCNDPTTGAELVFASGHYPCNGDDGTDYTVRIAGGTVYDCGLP
jgi:hypothetical protein